MKKELGARIQESGGVWAESAYYRVGVTRVWRGAAL
jgi:hypothetical protein